MVERSLYDSTGGINGNPVTLAGNLLVVPKCVGPCRAVGGGGISCTRRFYCICSPQMSSDSSNLNKYNVLWETHDVQRNSVGSPHRIGFLLNSSNVWGLVLDREDNGGAFNSMLDVGCRRSGDAKEPYRKN